LLVGYPVRYCGKPHAAKSCWGEVGQAGQPAYATMVDEGPWHAHVPWGHAQLTE
jgi:hypothetical protein